MAGKGGGGEHRQQHWGCPMSSGLLQQGPRALLTARDRGLGLRRLHRPKKAPPGLGMMGLVSHLLTGAAFHLGSSPPHTQ